MLFKHQSRDDLAAIDDLGGPTDRRLIFARAVDAEDGVERAQQVLGLDGKIGNLAGGLVGRTKHAAIGEIVAGSLYAQQVAAALLSVLGAVSLLLAALGLYSVLAYTVSQREHEFGIRLALGAETSDVVGLVLRTGMTLTMAGILVGAVLAIAVMKMAAGLLVGVSPGDPVAIAGSALFLSAIALLASYLPARRATRVDPMVTLREP